MDRSVRAASAATLLLCAAAHASTALGLSLAGDRLVTFDTGAVGVTLSNVAITGLASGESLLGLDMRPATGEIFAVSSSSRLYRVNAFTGAATVVAGGGATPLPTLNGTVAIDFNPAADRIRITTSTGQNLRANPNTGGLVSDDSAAFGALRYNTGDPNANLAPRIVATAYTNSGPGQQPGAAGTTLYAIDAQGLFSRNFVTIGSPGGSPVSPNDGRLFTVTSGAPFGLFSGDLFGFDITTINGSNVAFLSGQSLVAGTAFYSLDLTTGSNAFMGNTAVALRDFTIIPSPGAASVTALAGLIAARRRRTT